MGKGRDKRKKNKGSAVAGHGAAKTEAKTKKNAEKAARRAERAAEGDEDDIDALLAAFAIEDKAKSVVTVEDDCAPPSARVNATLVHNTSNTKVDELVMLGGELCDPKADKVHVHGDLYRYNCGKARWSRVSSPNSPPPRSAHQAVVHKSHMYVFGGEYTSPNQMRFHHYRDLWRLDLNTNEWDELPSKKGPSARSGCRMAGYKNKIILFGGFYDTGGEMKYYNDLWEFDIDELSWSSHGQPGQGPSPRSGHQMVVSGDVMYLYGGYHKVKDENEEDMEHGKALDDMWMLDLKTYKWEKVKKAGVSPSPRSSFVMVAHKRRALLFGGVTDNETRAGEGLSSEFFNDMFTFNLDSKRWFPAVVRPPSKKKGKGAGQGDLEPEASQADSEITDETAAKLKKIEAGMSESEKAKQTAIHRAAVKIQANFRGFVVRKAYKLYRIGGVVSEILYSPASYGIDMSVMNAPKPRARINATACVIKNTMWLWGGIVEIIDKEITLDDLWSLDLNKMDGWKCVKENTVGEEDFKDGGAASSDGDDSDEDDG